jgi:hypothetical protein
MHAATSVLYYYYIQGIICTGSFGVMSIPTGKRYELAVFPKMLALDKPAIKAKFRSDLMLAPRYIQLE